VNRVDAHHHLWDLTVRPQPWMVGDVYAPISRSFTLDEFAGLAAGAGIDASIVVQTVGDRAETVELLEVADTSDLIAAVVGWVDLTAADVGEQLAWLAQCPGGVHLRGIRHQVHDEPDPSWLCRPDVQRGIAAIGAAGLVYELLVKPPHLQAAHATVGLLDEVRFVVDHAGKPPIARQEFEPWNTGIRALARFENTYCKLSGLLTEAAWTTWTIGDLRPYVETVVEAFGVDRVMVGSDWPVCTLVTGYEAAIDVYDAALPGLSASERAAIHAGTASAVYGLAHHPAADPGEGPST